MIKEHQMRISAISWVVTILLIFMVSIASAATENEGKTGMAFLKVGVGARAAGMGEAYSAVASDATAAYWNPAGLVASDGSNIVLMHNRWLLDIRSEFGAVQVKKHFALHVYSYHIGDIPVRTIPSEEPLEETSAQYLSIGASYAHSFQRQLDAGITVKYLFEKIFVYSASGYAFDLGVRYKLLQPNIIVAGTLQNLGKMGKLDNESTRLPVVTRIGGMYHIPKEVGPMHFMVALDIVKPVEENLRLHLGSEILFWNQVALRGGYVDGYENRNVSFGVGVYKSAFQFDYSLTPLQEDFDTGHRFSLKISL